MSFFSKGLGLLGGGSSNPFSMFDKNGDGKITEEGQKYLFFYVYLKQP